MEAWRTPGLHCIPGSSLRKPRRPAEAFFFRAIGAVTQQALAKLGSLGKQKQERKK